MENQMTNRAEVKDFIKGMTVLELSNLIKELEKELSEETNEKEI